MELRRPLNTLGTAAIVGASTLVPLPLVDDWIASLSRRHLVATTLARHGRSVPVSDLKHLYDDGGSLIGLPWRMAKAIILAPINIILKKVLVVFAARDFALAVGKTIALGHTLERALERGGFRDEDTHEKRRDDAARLRKALDKALVGVDMRVLQRTTAAVIARARKKPVAAEDEAEVETFLAEIDRRVDEALGDIKR